MSEPPVYPGTPRNRNFVSYSGSLDSVSGPPRIDLPPIWSATDTYLEGFWTKGTENNATAIDGNFKQTYVFFPDPSAAGPQVWEVTWEGLLDGPALLRQHQASGAVGGSVSLREGGFCGNGVVKGDIVTLNGCANDSQCPLGAVCHKDPTVDQVPGGFTVTGLCVSPDTDKRDTCTPLAGTLRRYEIVSARDNELVIQPRLDEVVRSNVAPCRINGGGTSGAAGLAGTGGAGGHGRRRWHGWRGGMGGAAGAAPRRTTFRDCEDPNDPTTGTREFICTTDTTAARPRCLYPCDEDSGLPPRARLPRMCRNRSCSPTVPHRRSQPALSGVRAGSRRLRGRGAHRQSRVRSAIRHLPGERGALVRRLGLGDRRAFAGGQRERERRMRAQTRRPTSGWCRASPSTSRRRSRSQQDCASCRLRFVASPPVGAGQQLFSTPVTPTNDAEAEARLRVVKAPLDPTVEQPVSTSSAGRARWTHRRRSRRRHHCAPASRTRRSRSC